MVKKSELQAAEFQQFWRYKIAYHNKLGPNIHYKEEVRENT